MSDTGFPTSNKIYEGDYMVVCGFHIIFQTKYFMSYNNVVWLHGEAHFLHNIVILSTLFLFIFRSMAKGKCKVQRIDINVLNKT